MSVFLLSVSVLMAEQEEAVWYDASGKISQVTKIEAPKVSFEPAWVKREARRDQALRGRGSYVCSGRVQRYRSSRSYSGYRGYYGTGCHWTYYRRSYSSPWGFRGGYNRGGWSVRIGF